LTANDDDAKLIALGSEVSDGKSVDWESIQRAAKDDASKALFENLQRIATVIEAHRSTDAAVPTTAPPTAQPTTHWRHLVLLERAGEGAFGTVYRAWDTQLDREVALKLLSKSATAAREPLGEARHLARIRHPNVVMVYGAEWDDQQVGIWMEFIEGQTLAAMIADRGPMSAREVSGIGIDLCRALSALHGSGLLHRDIKAQNVMREIGGRIVLMDFGVVHAIEPDADQTELSGTPLYMAPEMLTGGPSSGASDIYSVGVLLFYLLSGRFPVEGTDLADIRAAHARGDHTRLRDLRPEVPESVVQVIECALEGDPKSRYRTAGELEHALASAFGGHAQSSSSESIADGFASGSRVSARWKWAAITAALVAAASITASVWRAKTPVPPPLIVRTTLGPPFNTSSWPRVSPDGRMVVFGTLAEGKQVLWIWPLASLEGKPLEASAGETPFWSPDSKFLAFFAGRKLRTIAVSGGGPQTLADAPYPRGGTWNGEGTLLYGANDRIYRVAADGSSHRQETYLDESRGEYQHSWPEFLPDGRRYLFLVRSSQASQSGIWIGSLDSPDRKRLIPAFSRTVYSRTGHLLFVREGTIMAQPFDPRTMTISGDAVGVAGPAHFHSAGDAAFDISNDGVLVYRPRSDLQSTQLMLFDRSGREVRAVAPAGFYRAPTFSPDGQRLAVERFDNQFGNPDVWLYDLARGSALRFTSGDAPDVNPVWSPDGRQIAFSSRRRETFDVYVKTVDAADPERLVDASPGDKYVDHWAPDGKSCAVTITRNGLWILPLTKDGKPVLVRGSKRPDPWQSSFSPDGRWITYVSNEGPTPEVFVEPVPATGERWQVSAQGGSDPHWRSDGRELIYLAPDGRVLGVGIVPGARWKAGPPYLLFRVSVPEPLGSTDISLSPDGQFVVVNALLAAPTVPPVHVVVNWAQLLNR
jgi:serine/threonine protein kinase/Tol biopolymer transport system component